MPIRTCQPFPPFIEQTMGRYGSMFYPMNDLYIGRSFREYGEYCAGEVDLFRNFVSPGATVLDIGANIGAHTVPLAQLAGPEGLVIAFEPQPIIHQILCANLAVNSIPNVRTYAMALGDKPGTCTIPALNYAATNNFGGVSLDMAAEGETVPVATLDSFMLERIHFIKMDVEGFESRALAGAAASLARCRPVLYVENDQEEKSAELIQRLFDLGYQLWWHTPPLFHPANFKGNPDNIFPRIHSINMLGMPREVPFATDLKPITAATDRCW